METEQIDYIETTQILKTAKLHPVETVECNYVTDIINKIAAKTYIISEFENIDGIFKLNHHKSDSLHPLKLIISGDMTKLHCLDKFGYSSVNNQNYMLYPVNFLIDVNTLEKTDDTIILDVSKSPYFNKYQCEYGNFIINMHENCDFKISMCQEIFYFNTTERKNSVMPSNQMMKYHECIKSDDITNKFIIKKIITGLTKGFFVKCNVEQLLTFKITFGLYTLFNYDNKMKIKMFCKKINDNLLYVPFDLSCDINNDAIETYNYGLDFTRWNDVEFNFELNFTESQNGLNIYTDSFNYFMCNYPYFHMDPVYTHSKSDELYHTYLPKYIHNDTIF